MCGISKSAFVFLGVALLAGGLALTPGVISTARASEKVGANPGATKPVKLVVGAKAPEFNPTNWVRGGPVSSFEPGRVYVVEFWATWCPPCLKSIPHLTKLQKQFKDTATVIGMASFERPSSPAKDDRLAKVEKFVKEQGEQMNYSVAFEDGETIARAWMIAAEQVGIPTVFVVGGDGKIAWIGSPLSPAFETKLKDAVDAAQRDKAVDKQNDQKPGDSEKR